MGLRKLQPQAAKKPCAPLTPERSITLILRLHTRGKRRNTVKTVCATRRCHSILIWSRAKLQILGPHVGHERGLFPPRLHTGTITEMKSRMTDMRFLWVTSALDGFMFVLADTRTDWLVRLTASPSLLCTQKYFYKGWLDDHKWCFQLWPPEGTLHSTAAGTYLLCLTTELKSNQTCLN